MQPMLRSILILAAVFAAATAAVTLPLWAQPYDPNTNFTLVSPAMVPAAVLLVAGTMVLVAFEIARTPRVFGIMALCAPVADMIVINRDWAIDPDSHNLMGIEIVFAAVQGLAFVVAGLVLGLVLRAWLSRRRQA